MMWRLLLPSVLLVVVPVLAVVCPGGKVKCPENMTCCSLANHEFGCCTYPEAQCCQDHVHCCPNGMKCDERHQACLKNGFPALFFSQISVKPLLVEEPIDAFQTNHIDDTQEGDTDSNTCPDGHECPSSFTCCKMFRGNYGCCPYDNAKCCKDGFHCCPHGSQCDPVSGGCQNGGNWLSKAASLMKGQKPKSKAPEPLEVADPGGKCPDGHPCLEKFTCCKVQDGGYGCCPYTEGICCTDHIHCCPKNTNCNNSLGTCDVEKRFSVRAYSLTTLKLSDTPALVAALAPSPPPLELMEDTPNMICPDGRSSCYPGNTCCPNLVGSYSCCPYVHATCCIDHMHCCPYGFHCTAYGTCVRASSGPRYPFLPPISMQQKPASSVPSPKVEEESVKCSDGSKCPDGNTCCSISSSRFGCCPMPKATCCGDMTHCCPHGYWCADQGCERMEGTTLNKTLVVHHSLEVDSPKVMLAP